MKALVIIDMQNDFMPNGTLPVPQANAIIPLINDLTHHFPLVVATQDYHPLDHMSFAANHPGKKVGDIIEMGSISQVLWPVHCVQGRLGAELVSTLNRSSIEAVFPKGTSKDVDSYSAFFDNARHKSTGLEIFLKKRGVTDLYLVGVATDYCVLASALDALKLGFQVHLIADACAGVNLQLDDSTKAFDLVQSQGGHVLLSAHV